MNGLSCQCGSLLCWLSTQCLKCAMTHFKEWHLLVGLSPADCASSLDSWKRTQDNAHILTAASVTMFCWQETNVMMTTGTLLIRNKAGNLLSSDGLSFRGKQRITVVRECFLSNTTDQCASKRDGLCGTMRPLGKVNDPSWGSLDCSQCRRMCQTLTNHSDLDPIRLLTAAQTMQMDPALFELLNPNSHLLNS